MRRSSSRPASSPSVSALPRRPASAKLGFSSDGRFSEPSVFPVYHPVPASCSVRLTFVSFMVRISVSFCVQFRSFSARFQLIPVRFVFLFVSAHSLLVQFSLFGFRSVQFVFSSIQFSFSSFSVRFQLVLCSHLCARALLFIYSRVYYTRLKANFKCIFCQKTCPF